MTIEYKLEQKMSSNTPIFVDVETDGCGSFRDGTHRIIQLGWSVGNEYRNYYVKGCKYINPQALHVHKITLEHLETHGYLFNDAIQPFLEDLRNVDNPMLVAHNVQFDYGCLVHNMKLHQCSATDIEFVTNLKCFCTMKNSTDFCQLPGKWGQYKWPSLLELRRALELEEKTQVHDAIQDVILLKEVYTVAIDRGIFASCVQHSVTPVVGVPVLSEAHIVPVAKNLPGRPFSDDC